MLRKNKAPIANEKWKQNTKMVHIDASMLTGWNIRRNLMLCVASHA